MTVVALAEFAVRLAAGLAAGLLLLGRAEVPAGFVRTVWLVILGLAALAAVSIAGAPGVGPAGPMLWAVLGLGFAASVLWGLGADRPGVIVGAAATTAAFASLIGLPSPSRAESGAAMIAVRCSSSCFMGTVTLAMLLGHHYLTAPSMSLTPLRRLVIAAAVGLGLRMLPAMAGIASIGAEGLAGSERLFLAMRWGMGLVVPAIGLGLAWGTLRIGSTQSATGILYVSVALTLVGELAAMMLSGQFGFLV